MSGRLIRLLTAAEMREAWHRPDEYRCVWRDCGVPVMYRIATPHGEWDICDAHVDYLIAELPAEWISGWAYREPFEPLESDGIPF